MTPIDFPIRLPLRRIDVGLPGVSVECHHRADGGIEVRATFTYYAVAKLTEEAVMSAASESALIDVITTQTRMVVESLIDGAAQQLAELRALRTAKP